MPQILQFVATLCAALFAGAALYINVAEHPVRVGVTLMQAPLALVGFFYALGAWLLGGAVTWLIAALIIGIVVPFTYVDLMPKWERLRGMRTLSAVTPAIIMLYALVIEPGL